MATFSPVAPQFQEDFSDLPLWRYMSTASFLHLIAYSELRFNSVAEYQDKFEGAPHQQWVQFWTGKHTTHGSDPKRAAQIVNRQIAEMRKTTFASCWHQSDDESDAMWKIYSRLEEGIAIRSSTKRLRQALQACELSLWEGLVKYGDVRIQPWNVPDVVTWSFVKRQSFSHEKEYRIVAHGVNTGSLALSVDLNSLIVEVVISPWMKDWFVATIQAICGKYELPAAVKKSHLLDPPPYLDSH